MVCLKCGGTDGHTFECPSRPKGSAPLNQVDWRIIEALVAVYEKRKTIAGTSASNR